MKLQYLGCSAFVFKSENGTSFGIDFWNKGAFPYSEDSPEEINVSNGDIERLLITHDHDDHCFIPEGVKPYFGVENGNVKDCKEALRVGSIKIEKYNSAHFYPEWKIGEKANTVFKFNMDGMEIVHLGDCHGTMADKKLVDNLKKRIGKVDILLLPIGSPWLKKFPIEPLVETISTLNPRIIIPMHYWKVEDKKDFVRDVLDRIDGVKTYSDNYIEFTKKDIPKDDVKEVWNITAGSYTK